MSRFGFTALQWREAHNQLLLSLKPSVDFDIEEDSDDPPVGVSIGNAGPGPAIIKAITYYVDKKSVGNVDKFVDFANLQNVSTYDFDGGDTLAVGEHRWLLAYKNKPLNKGQVKEVDSLLDFLDHHVGIEVEFCPALPGQCSSKCSQKGWCR